MEAVVVFIVMFTGLFAIIYYYLQTRHKERISLIESGADAKLFQTEPKKRNYFFAMLLGILFVSLGLGIGVGYGIDVGLMRKSWHHGENPVPYFISIFIFLGAGFITAFFLHRKMTDKE